MLKIIKETDPIAVNQLVLCIYAPPGVGKTSIGFTAAAPILLDFDTGAYRAANRRDSVGVTDWRDVAAITADDLADYQTVVVDTAGRALDTLTADIIARDPKKGRGGALTLQGYGSLKSDFTAWLKQLRMFGKDVVLLAHSDEKQNGDDLIERLDMQGGSKNEIYKCADVMGRLAIRNGKRVLNFSPSETAFGKNPAGFDLLDVPSFAAQPDFLAQVIADTKAALNKLTEAQQVAQSMLADWRAKMDEAESADDFNALMPKVAKADEAVRDNAKVLLVQIAKDKGIGFDKKAKKFQEPAQAQVA